MVEFEANEFKNYVALITLGVVCKLRHAKKQPQPPLSKIFQTTKNFVFKRGTSSPSKV